MDDIALRNLAETIIALDATYEGRDKVIADLAQKARDALDGQDQLGTPAVSHGGEERGS